MKKYFYLFSAFASILLVSCSSRNGNNEAAVSQVDSDYVESPLNAHPDGREEAADEIYSISVLTDMYNSFILTYDNPNYKELTEKEADEFIEAHISKDLKKKLQDLNDIDDGGLAWYELRGGMQDGDGESKLTEINAIGDNWYRVDFLDMGEKCQKEFQVKDGVVINYR